jgi:hypothetical protein
MNKGDLATRSSHIPRIEFGPTTWPLHRPDEVRRRRTVIRPLRFVCDGPDTLSLNTVNLQIAVKFFPQFSSGTASSKYIRLRV